MLSSFIEEIMEAKKKEMVATFGKYTYKMEGIQVEQHMCCSQEEQGIEMCDSSR